MKKTALVLAALSLAAAPVVSQALHAQGPAAVEPSDRWLDGLKGQRRQLFDSPAPAGGIALVHIMNYYDTYNKAYQVKDQDIDAVMTFYGQTTFHGVNDAMWEKYQIADFFETGAKGGNPWRTSPTVLGMSLPQASIESLQKRGTTFIVCNNALTILSGMLAQKRGLDPAKVYADMKANLLPGVHLVPAMVIAVEQAQKAGLTYHRQ